MNEWKTKKRKANFNLLRQLLYLSKGFGSYQAKYTEMDSQRSAQTVLNNNNGKMGIVVFQIFNQFA